MGVVALLLGALLSTAFTLGGLTKLLNVHKLAISSWKPTWISSRTWMTVLKLSAVVEVALGVGAMLFPGYLLSSSLILALAGLTVYGVAATRRGAPCGCSGALETNSPSRLLARNLGLAVLAALVGIPMTPTPRDFEVAALILAAIPSLLVAYGIIAATRGRRGSTWEPAV
jgi:cation transporter-like permease